MIRGRFLALLLAPLLVAGCSGSPSQSSAPTPTDTSTPSPTPTAHAAATTTGFAVDGPTIAPVSGNPDGVYEDDGVKVAYTVSQPANASGAASFFVTFLFNKSIVSTDTLTLQPGQSKAFQQTFPNVTGMKEVLAEVRAGSTDAKANATIQAWPRLGADTSLDGLRLKVASVGIDPADNATVANVTFTHDAGAPLTVSDVHAKLRCGDATGNVTQKGDVDFPPPDAGSSIAQDARFPACSDARGLAFTGVDVATGKHVAIHVLFPAGSVGTYVAPTPPAI